VAALLQIEKLLDRKPSQLSGGQRQRVAMGRALVRDQLLFLFDEPLSNLDAKLRVEMRMEIKQLHQRIRSTNVYVTHDQIEAMTMATRIAVMHQGEIQQFADPDTVYNRPANLFVARFMGAPPMNTLPARIEAAAGGVRAVVGQGETAVSLPLPAAFAAQAGREVVLGLRPECIAEEDRRFGHGGERVTLELPVEMTEPTGAETIVLARLGGERALARVSPDVRLQPGDREATTGCGGNTPQRPRGRASGDAPWVVAPPSRPPCPTWPSGGLRSNAASSACSNAAAGARPSRWAWSSARSGCAPP
jgi:multiple sugar transport system ATP-binding protein